jgi:transcriptional regulator with XRE-family HTH domain
MKKNDEMSKRTPYSFLPEEKEYFAKRLKQAIGQESIKSIARDIGTSDSTLHHYLSGNGLPTLERLVALARRLNVSIGWLAIGEGEMLQDRPLEHENYSEAIYDGDIGSTYYIRPVPPNITERMRHYNELYSAAVNAVGWKPSDFLNGSIQNLLLLYPVQVEQLILLLQAIETECGKKH